MNKHLLSIHDVTAEDIVRVLDTADSFREVGTRVIKKVPALRGRTVVNLFYEHPTQALLDLYTIRERLGRLEGLRTAIVGDVLHSRVARSLSFALVKMGAEVTLVGPPTLLPPDAPAWGVRVSHDIGAVLPELDVCYVLRVQRE